MVFVLVIFAALPGAGILCAPMCDDSTAALTSARDSANEHCDKARHDSMSVQFKSAPAHDCRNHGAAIRQVALARLERIDLHAVAAGTVLSSRHMSFSSQAVTSRAFDDLGPPGIAARKTTPLVLRV
jgi:hypothetical protein